VAVVVRRHVDDVRQPAEEDMHLAAVEAISTAEEFDGGRARAV
jgi:hypothetical protein